MKRQMKTMDGNNAAAHVSYAFTDVAAIYPITPSSVMAEVSDEWAVAGRKNLFGRTVQITEMQSEAGASGTVHGSLAAGALTTTYTASQGLLLMIPNLYKIAAERLPGVFHVSARTISSHALAIFGDHSDVYACRQTGVAMLCEGSVQEVMDLAPVAHLAAIEGRLPFINFFDGFRTSHEIQKIEVWDYKDLDDMLDKEAVQNFRDGVFNPNRPYMMGSSQNPDIFFQVRETCNGAYNDMPEIVQKQMDKINAKLGTDYALFNYYGDPDAERVIIAMGSVNEAAVEAVDYLRAKGEKVGIIKVRLFRPFSAKHLIDAIPDSVKLISVLDRSKEPGSMGEPLYQDVVTALKGSKFDSVPVLRGRYGLSSKDTTPGQIISVFHNEDKQEFTIGINDDVTHLSLDVTEDPNTTPEGTISCKFWGLGSDGTVGANKNSIKIIGDNTDMYAQAYFDYDSKKSGGVTVSHLRFGKEPIRSTYLISKANFVACHNTSYILKYSIAQDLVDGGTFLLNCSWDVDELTKQLPPQTKRYIAEHKINFYTIDAVAIGKKIGLGGRVNTVLQSAFFKLANIIPEEDAIRLMKEAAKKSYGKKGDKVVQMNYDAIDAGAQGVVKVDYPESWADAEGETKPEAATEGRQDQLDFVNNIQAKINLQQGYDLPVSTFMEYSDGRTPNGTSQFEKRGIATDVPVWDATKCIACNRCAYVCPHAAIRPFALTEDEAANAPEGMQISELKGTDYKFTMGISVMDCTGCGSCVNVCPAKEKAIQMAPIAERLEDQKYFDYAVKTPQKDDVVEKFKIGSVKGSQFRQPLLEFSGACAGCGETPYAKLLTQLFGDRMYVANATGCSSIWGNSSPSTPYSMTPEGKGPAWSNSLFEDAAEFGLGMNLAQKAIRSRLREDVESLCDSDAAVKSACEKWVETYESSSDNIAPTNELIDALTKNGSDTAREVLKDKDFLAKKSQWIFGGDGWAYDIGFGGLDHVIASGENINIMVFDTEVYSNTGGQASKSTPTGAVAQFAAGGKVMKKKDLAGIAMSYGYVYVAMVSMGADMNQCVKAMIEAESYDGPSIIIAYAPCINHGIKKGMDKAMTEEELAVKSGYWHMFRYDPRLKEQGKNAFILDSKTPDYSGYKEFLDGEVRYNSLRKVDADKAEALFAESEEFAKERYEYLNKLVSLYGSEA
ncbi:MAG: pyruvate:ferredoxin (flavodoxin) oxidoreductase [Eubacterium sp.]|nr:pyruvate:ferredoxin (flavodoxin) oxidoreductase [Eubacterium sp.]